MPDLTDFIQAKADKLMKWRDVLHEANMLQLHAKQETEQFRHFALLFRDTVRFFGETLWISDTLAQGAVGISPREGWLILCDSKRQTD